MRPCVPPLCSPSEIQPSISFNVTIIDDKVLLVRLTAELRRLLKELRLSFAELRDDPQEFLRVLWLQASAYAKRQITLSNVFGFTSAVLVVTLSALLITAVDRTSIHRVNEQQGDDGDSLNRPVMLVLTPLNNGPSIYPRSIGRVGLRSGVGEGSLPTPASAHGGGSGGLGDLASAQRGKVPQPSEIPSVIPKEPPLNPPSLPRAGVDLDPALWSDIKYVVYGDPNSRSEIPSNGPGKDGGMGTNRGLGIGDGRGNGFGTGEDGNTGGDRRGIGGGLSGGAGGLVRRDGPFRSSEVDEKVRLLSKPEPHYTEEARRQGLSGTVILRVIFSSTGEITQISAVQGLPFGLTERAIAAAREIKFLPAKKNGRPVSVYMQLEYNFNLY
jgi:TonB family protein